MAWLEQIRYTQPAQEATLVDCLIAQMEPPLAIGAHCLGMAVLEIEDLSLAFVSGHHDQCG